MKIGWMIRSGGVWGSVREAIEICNVLTRLGHDVTIYTDSGVDENWLPNVVKWDKKEVVSNTEFDYLVFSDSPDEPYFTLFKEAKARLKSGCLMGFDGNPQSLQTPKLKYLFEECLGISDGPWQLKYLNDGFAIGGINISQFKPQDVEKRYDVVWSGDTRKKKDGATVIKATEGMKVESYYGRNLSQQQLPEFISAGIVFADAHIRGGWCNPVLEAMACGVAVVCTETNCNSDFAIHGYSCFKVKEFDWKSMNYWIKVLLNDWKTRAMFIQNGLYTAAQYDYNIIGAKFEKEIITRLNCIAD